ncbi:MAG: hypothetical protein O3A51_03665 [Verrucomicrobia bacterium]|nr:hypothetical protein [Verrucomicrobiota bacterium]
MRVIAVLMLAGLLIATVGCELPQLDGSSESTSGASSGSAGWGNFQWQGQPYDGGEQVMSLTAIVTGSHVHFTWDTWPFGGNMPAALFFVWDGNAWRGGRFEWIRPRGQSSKSLGNIRSGYNGLRAPASGTPVAFAWVSADGSRRSNLATTTWP